MTYPAQPILSNHTQPPPPRRPRNRKSGAALALGIVAALIVFGTIDAVRSWNDSPGKAVISPQATGAEADTLAMERRAVNLMDGRGAPGLTEKSLAAVRSVGLEACDVFDGSVDSGLDPVKTMHVYSAMTWSGNGVKSLFSSEYQMTVFLGAAMASQCPDTARQFQQMIQG